MLLFYDCESVGLTGATKLIQYAIDDGPVRMIPLFRGWESDVATKEALACLLSLLNEPATCFTAYNASFDLFHTYRLAHRLMGYEYDSAERPVMPFKCRVLDLQVPAMLKSPLAPFAFNRAGGKSVALLRRIPKVAMEQVAGRVVDVLKPLLPQSFDLGVGIHKVAKQPELVTLSFNVKGRLSLKGLMQDYGINTLKLADCWPLPDRSFEKPWLPYLLEQGVHDPIEAQCDEVLRGPKDSAFYRYSQLDILYLKVLYEKLGCPEPDYNSDNVHNMAYLRYYGFDLDRQALLQAESYYGQRVGEIEQRLSGVNLRSSTDRLRFLQPHFPILASTNKHVLKKLAEEDSEGGRLCEMILDYGPSRQRLLQIQKVLECKTGRAHPSLRVMGTATNRMAGEAGLNWQGIGAVDEVLESELVDDLPETEPLDGDELAEQEAAGEEKKLKVGLRNALLTPCVGDWSSFEVVIAASVYDDKQLQADLRDGIDLHSMTVATAHPKALAEGWTYEQIREAYTNDKHPKHHQVSKWRKAMKTIVFGIFYFASAMKVAETLGIPEHEGQAVLNRFYGRYTGIGRYRADIERRFITADVESWGKGSVRDMECEQTDLTGFHRRWDFEKSVACALWELGSVKGIKTGLQGKVTRTPAKGPQTIDMAITSACLGSAIAIQAAVSRQAGNMPVQATGATLTKQLAAKLWNELRVPTAQIHDELFPPHHPNYNYEKYSEAIDQFVDSARLTVPMVKFDYKPCRVWGDK